MTVKVRHTLSLNHKRTYKHTKMYWAIRVKRTEPQMEKGIKMEMN